jgi:dimethylargininase
MPALTALTRAVSPRIAACELTFIGRQPIDYAAAVHQHNRYQQLLRDLGLKVIELPADDQCPDSCFLEDTALVLDEVAVITRPGSEARRREVSGVVPTIVEYRNVLQIDAPGTLEAGDILRMGRNLFVGSSVRSNQQGIEMLRTALQPYEYKVVTVPMQGALHLKSVCTALDDHTLLADLRHVDAAVFSEYRLVEVPSDESPAANVLRINGTVCIHAGFQKTIDLLQSQGYELSTVDISEFLKAEAGLTCMSIIFDATAA